ncbi:MAG: DUF72 domain-containing protein [Planctomycetota bacterium]
MADNRSFFAVGCSGFKYLTWRGAFYPVTADASGMLEYYCGQFSTVELNTSYYGFLRPETLSLWAAQVPPGFIFSLKVPRSLACLPPGPEMKAQWEQLMFMIDPLNQGQALGALLFQVPAGRERDIESLEALASLARDRGIDTAFEFRHPSWHTPEVRKLLEGFHHDVAAVSLPEQEPFLDVISSFKYFRLSGRRREGNHDYTFRELLAWKEQILAAQEKAARIYVYFNNHAKGCAPLNARNLFRRVLHYSPDP